MNLILSLAGSGGYIFSESFDMSPFDLIVMQRVLLARLTTKDNTAQVPISSFLSPCSYPLSSYLLSSYPLSSCASMCFLALLIMFLLQHFGFMAGVSRVSGMLGPLLYAAIIAVGGARAGSSCFLFLRLLLFHLLSCSSPDDSIVPFQLLSAWQFSRSLEFT